MVTLVPLHVELNLEELLAVEERSGYERAIGKPGVFSGLSDRIKKYLKEMEQTKHKKKK